MAHHFSKGQANDLSSSNCTEFKEGVRITILFVYVNGILDRCSIVKTNGSSSNINRDFNILQWPRSG